MELNAKVIALIVVISAIGGAWIDRQVSTRTQIVDHEVVKNHVVTVTKEITRPDGTKETDTTTTDTSTKQETKTTTIAVHAPDWNLGVSVLTPVLQPVYQLDINRRILGPVFLGASVRTDKTLGLRVGVEF